MQIFIRNQDSDTYVATLCCHSLWVEPPDPIFGSVRFIFRGNFPTELDIFTVGRFPCATLVIQNSIHEPAITFSNCILRNVESRYIEEHSMEIELEWMFRSTYKKITSDPIQFKWQAEGF